MCLIFLLGQGGGKGDAVASLIDDNAELAEIAGAEFTVNYTMLY